MALSTLLSLVAEETHDMSLLLREFEVVVIVVVGFLAFLMYLFYVRYPYHKDP